jgi:hypothetical protein
MQKDERIAADVQWAQSAGYKILQWGIFAVLLYQWFYLGLNLGQTLPVFAVWAVASLTEFILLAVRGVPIAYPVSLTRKEQFIYIVSVPVLTGLLPLIVLHVTGSLQGFSHALGIFFRTSFVVLVLFSGYRGIVSFWEKRNL